VGPIGVGGRGVAAVRAHDGEIEQEGWGCVKL
jgi:hypothetical protein